MAFEEHGLGSIPTKTISNKSTDKAAATSNTGSLEGSFKEIEEKIKDVSPSLFMDYLINENKKSIKDNSQSIFLLEGNSEETPAIVNNRIFTFAKENRELANLTSKEISSLVPFIKIYKVFNETDSGKNKTIEVEFPFEDYSSPWQMENIFKTKVSRGSGIGLISFDWKSLGKQEANIAQYSAKLKLHVQDINELDKIRNSKDGYDLSLIDLVYPQIKNNETKDSFKYDKNKMHLKAVVGWIGENSSANDSFGTYSMLLNLIRHNFDFKEDGSIDLEIEYMASLEMESRDNSSNNVLSPKKQKIYEKIDRIVKKLENEIQKFEKDEGKQKEGKGLRQSRIDLSRELAIIDRDAKNSLTNSFIIDAKEELSNPNANISNPVESTKKAIEILKSIPSEEKKGMLRTILEGFESGNKIKYLVLEENAIQSVTTIIKQGEKNEVGDESEVETIKNELTFAKLSIEENKGIISPTNLELAKMVDESTDESKGESERFQTLMEDLDSKLKESVSSEFPNLIVIPFLSLYDVISEFLKNCDFLSKKDNRLVLGEFSYKDYDLYNTDAIYKKKKIKTDDGKDKESYIKIFKLKERRANFADIPITLKSFINWYNSSIINKNIKKMSANSVINLLMTQLVPINIKNNHVKFLPSYKVRHNNKFLKFSKEIEKKMQFNTSVQQEQEDSNLGIPQIISKEEFQNSRPFKLFDYYGKYISPKTFYNLKDFINKSDSNGETVNYFFIVSREEEYSIGEGNYEDDWIKNSVFHFIFGEEKGLMKKISFSRQDSQKLHSAMIDSSVRSENPEEEGFVRELYKCNIEMFGNNLFEPGNTVFVSPIYPGLGLRNEIMFKIGLGGYYTVLSVENSISSGEFSTALECQWQSFGNIDLGSTSELIVNPSAAQQLSIEKNLSNFKVE